MTLRLTWILLSFLFPAIILGCSGYDRILFATKTNVGLDIDNQPPTAEFTIARREIAIQPTFPDYQSKQSGLPLLAAFGLSGNFFNPGITGDFAGGDAAVYLVKEDKEDQDGNDELDSALCLDKEPSDSRGPLLQFWHWITGQKYEDVLQEPRPFYFATDSSYGVKVAWSGTAGPYPDSLKLGYNRKEFASPPVFVEGKEDFPNQNDQKCKDGHRVKIPSFYASIDNAGGYTTFTESGVTHVQFFATGKAATEFAKRKEVKAIAFNRMAPKAARQKAKQIGLNQALIKEIETEFNKADSAKKKEIMKKAVELNLIKDDIQSADVVKALQQTHANSPDPGVSTSLIEIRRILLAPPT